MTKRRYKLFASDEIAEPLNDGPLVFAHTACMSKDETMTIRHALAPVPICSPLSSRIVAGDRGPQPGACMQDRGVRVSSRQSSPAPLPTSDERSIVAA